MNAEMETAVRRARQVAQELATRADEADRRGELPVEDVQLLQTSGYLSLSVPKVYGGQGLSLRDCLAAHVEVAQGSAATALVAGMPLHIFGHQREVCSWPEAVWARFCRATVEGALFNFVASEPRLGSPSRGGLPESTAERSADGRTWIVNGHKTWSTGGRHLSHMLVRVAMEGEPGVVLVEQDRPGIEWVSTWRDALSLRASDSHDVYFNNVVVPAENVVERGEGKPAASVWFPMVMAAVYLGTALAARNEVIRFALERVPTALGKPIATLPSIQRQIGEIDVALQATCALFFQVAGEWTEDDADRAAIMPRITAAKTLVMETANEVTEKALRIAGGASLTRALPLERYFRDVRAGLMQPPSGDTALEIIGRAAVEAVAAGREV
jgi:alkylation response protein AidB-like acyl-CoA dehydrogenase